MNILAIDPGSEESAYVVVDDNMKPNHFDKIPNGELISMVHDGSFNYCEGVAIEMIASYGMAVGQEVFETCVFIGSLLEAFANRNIICTLVYRKEAKMCLCGNPSAKDSNIQKALIDFFARHDRKRGKGTKDNQDWFYGFHDDIWAAYAVAITYADKNGKYMYVQ